MSLEHIGLVCITAYYGMSITKDTPLCVVLSVDEYAFFTNALRGLAIEGFDFSCFTKMERMQNSHKGNYDK